VRLVTWNVAGRVTRQPEQAQAVAAIGADVVALQEVTARTLPLWRAALSDAGFTACEATLDDPPATDRRRLLGVLVAAREWRRTGLSDHSALVVDLERS
jgi:endonuclease/exonuclease/phosphatase family metal-dependent hydrolase